MLRSHTSLAAAALSLAVLACDSSTAPHGGQPGPATSAAAANAPMANGVQERVTGSAHLSIFDNNAEQYQFSAVRHHDGGVSGQFELKSSQDGGLRVHGEVLCFRINGNQARLAGVVTQSTDPQFMGVNVQWNVVDNGEGANDPPDQTSDFFAGGVPEQFCAASFTFGMVPVEQGNIQVHAQ